MSYTGADLSFLGARSMHQVSNTLLLLLINHLHHVNSCLLLHQKKCKLKVGISKSYIWFVYGATYGDQRLWQVCSCASLPRDPNSV